MNKLKKALIASGVEAKRPPYATNTLVITIKPLTHGYGRITITEDGEKRLGPRIKTRQFRSFKMAHVNQHLRRIGKLSKPSKATMSRFNPQPQVILRRAKMDLGGDVLCPHCLRYNYEVKEGEMFCKDCGKKFIVDK